MAGPSAIPASFAREHHLHYDVTPEEVAGTGGRQTVGFDLRVFATHDRASLASPGCAECSQLLTALRAFAEDVVQRSGRGAAPVEILSDPSTLYQSTEDSGKDEVAVTIRVGPLAPGARDEDPPVAELRHALDAAGVARR